jgi:predicted Rdx family selenoprotein
MLTIPNVVEEVIKKKPFLEGALIEGLINLSALARQLRGEIEQRLGKPVNESAIIMALNRLVPRLELTSTMKFRRIIAGVGDIIVRSNLTDFTYNNTATLYGRQEQLLREVYSAPTAQDVLCTFSQGIYETTLVVSSSLGGIVERIFQDEMLVLKRDRLSSITVKLPPENTACPGVYYYIFKELAWDNINIAEVISTSNEFTVVVSDADIHRAFTILMEAKRGVQ